MDFSKFKKSTTSVWGGESDVTLSGAVTSPIVNSVAFAYKDVDHWHDVSLGKAEGYIYSRNTNPTVAVLEEKNSFVRRRRSSHLFCNWNGSNK